MNAQRRVTTPPLEQNQSDHGLRKRCQTAFFVKKNATSRISIGHAYFDFVLKMAEVVTSSAHMEVLRGKRVMSFLAGLGCELASGLSRTPARETCWETAQLFSSKASPSAPSLSGIPGTGAILF